MALFSDRQGLNHKAIQVENIDADLRNGLWNAVHLSYTDVIYAESRRPYVVPYGLRNYDPDWMLKNFCKKLMTDVTKEPLPNWGKDPKLNKEVLVDTIRDIMLNTVWYQVYDIVEFFVNNFPASDQVHHGFRDSVNAVLKQENSGYRFVGNHLARITADEEIAAVEETLKLAGPFAPASAHIQKALRLLSDRENPDYPNSINESISAVEAACRVITGNPKATLSQAFKKIEDETAHPALKAAFERLYGWTSDAAGIRHAMTGDTSAGFAEAQFMVVACSAFVNYLTGKYRSS